MSDSIIHKYKVDSSSFESAGEASSDVKKILKSLGVSPIAVKKMAISLYEAEMNTFIHANGGEIEVKIDPKKVICIIRDRGPGIPDIDLAMKEGYSTAPDRIREMGFGAGMGLPNMRRHADEFEIDSQVDKGTTVKLTVYID